MKNEARLTSELITNGWKLAYWVLFACWVVGAALTMWRIPAGFLSNYLSDLAFPPWFYILLRQLSSPRSNDARLLRWFGRSPERAVLSIFAVGVLSELSQINWPNGIFRGTYDPWDIAAYAIGLGICYTLDKWQVACCERAIRAS